jgi:hypothetical protein
MTVQIESESCSASHSAQSPQVTSPSIAARMTQALSVTGADASSKFIINSISSIATGNKGMG